MRVTQIFNEKIVLSVVLVALSLAHTRTSIQLPYSEKQEAQVRQSVKTTSQQLCSFAV